ncbi:hypothetical protein GCM10011392_38120 [Wenxinia marina]|nr:hypothetical protein GCM10011392_38120 [Wenxinia marina]
MKYIFGLFLAALLAALSYYLGYWQVGVIPFAGVGIAYVASVAGASGAVIFSVLSLGGRVNIITFLGILVTVSILIGAVWTGE